MEAAVAAVPGRGLLNIPQADPRLGFLTVAPGPRVDAVMPQSVLNYLVDTVETLASMFGGFGDSAPGERGIMVHD